MCRYGLTTYKTHFGCFACRKVFRRLADRASGRVDRCPDCGAPMADLGMDLRAPRRTATKQWRLLQGMFTVGHAFQTCGCDGPGLIPANKRECRLYLRDALGRYRANLATAQRRTAASSAAEREYWSARIALVREELARVRLPPERLSGSAPAPRVGPSRERGTGPARRRARSVPRAA